MTEKFPNPNKKNKELETKEAPELAENIAESAIKADIAEAKRLYAEGEFKKALDLLDVAIDKAYRAQEMDLYEEIGDLMDEWGDIDE